MAFSSCEKKEEPVQAPVEEKKQKQKEEIAPIEGKKQNK